MQYGRSGKLEVPSALAVDGPVTGLPKVILGQILATHTATKYRSPEDSKRENPGASQRRVQSDELSIGFDSPHVC